MDRPITRAQFLSVNRDKTIETAPIYGKPDIPEKVQAAFVRADLNADGRIAGDREMSALFSAIDTFDTDGNCHSVRARAKSLALVERGAQSPSGQASTPSTRLKALLRARPALKTHQDMIRLCLNIGQGDWQLGQRVAQTFGLDLNRLTDNRSAILSGTSATSPTTLSQRSVEELIGLSDPNTLVDEYDARRRITRIADIFTAEPDPIGMFAIVYRHITNNAVQSVEDGLYDNPVWTRHLITAFARRYLENLHGHLTDGEVTPQWTKYYKIARNCDVGRGRVLGVAIATHLMVDLVYALYDVESVAEQEEDYMLFGEVSLWVFPNLVEDIQAVYNTDVSGLLQGFFFGDWVDGITSEGTTTTFIYQTVRANAWRNSQNLWRFPHWMVNADVRSGWALAEVSLASLDAVGAL